MSNEQEANRCPKCQGPLPPEAPQGLCAKCLLEAVASPTESGQPREKTPPPPIHTVVAAFPQLEIIELIGHGGMGVVYKARQTKLDRFVALKLMSESLACEPAFAERFAREARTLARLSHPNIVNVYDYGQADGFYYLLMEYVDGINLRQALQAGRFTPSQALSLVPKICEALQFAHEEGILHRDIKPENILLDSRGRIKIADFGIAKLLGEAREDNTLTATGAAMGTPQYMAPEQLEHRKDIDQRADIYSLGVVFYELLTGELPIGRFAPPSQKSGVDPRIDEVVLRTLEKEREKRYGTAGEVKSKVEYITGTEGAPPPPATTEIRTAKAFLSTPERMRQCFKIPRTEIFQSQGGLVLDGENLTFNSSCGQTVVMPLREIEHVSIGQFRTWHLPRLTKYESFNFLVIVLKRNYLHLTYYVTPALPVLNSSRENEAHVAEWCQAIQKAVKNKTGAAPRAGEATGASMTVEPYWPLKASLLMMGLVLGWVLLPHQLMEVIWVVPFAFLMWYFFGFLVANTAVKKGDFDAVTSTKPWQAAEPGASIGVAARAPSQVWRKRRIWAWAGGTALVLLAIPALIITIYMLTHEARPKRSRSALPAQAVLEPSPAPEASRFPGLQSFRWRYTIPAGYIATFSFLTTSNGVTTFVEPLSCWVAGRTDKSSKGFIQWNVQDGKMLSPELQGQERWDCKREHGADSGSTASISIWTRGFLAPGSSQRSSGRAIYFGAGEQGEIFTCENTNLKAAVEMRLEKLPPGIARRLMTTSSDGTNWMSLLPPESDVNQ